MSQLPSVKTYISYEMTRYRAAVSEFFAQTLGKTMNWLIDNMASLRSDLSTSLDGKLYMGIGNFSYNGNPTFTVPAGRVWAVFQTDGYGSYSYPVGTELGAGTHNQDGGTNFYYMEFKEIVITL